MEVSLVSCCASGAGLLNGLEGGGRAEEEEGEGGRVKSVKEGEKKEVGIAEKRKGIAGRFLREKFRGKRGCFSARAWGLSFGKG